MFSVELPDPSTFAALVDRATERIRERVKSGCVAAAGALAEGYRDELLAIQSPPHSEPGEIPHKYDGPREGGWGWRDKQREMEFAGSPAIPFEADIGRLGDVFGIDFDPFATGENLTDFYRKNNHPPRFSKEQGDDEYLATFIQHVSSADGGSVGFSPEGSHVTMREQNYLIHHDQGTVPGDPNGSRRPWIIPIYESSKPRMHAAFEQGANDLTEVPF